MKYPIYNASTGQKISILDLAHIINEVGPNNVPINILNDGMNLEYTSNNDRIKQEIPDLIFTSHQEGIKQLFSYFQENLDTIDIETVKRDPYLKKCHTIWKPTS
jgi:GDP-L-fucose synthase